MVTVVHPLSVKICMLGGGIVFRAMVVIDAGTLRVVLGYLVFWVPSWGVSSQLHPEDRSLR